MAAAASSGDSSDAPIEKRTADGIIYRSIRKFERNTVEESAFVHYAKLVFALLILYGLYIAFGACWLAGLNQLGEDLLWGFFGFGMATFGGMGAGVYFSMSRRKSGWWEPKATTRDHRGEFCGFKFY